MSEKRPKLIDVEADIPEQIETETKQKFKDYCVGYGNPLVEWEALPSDLKNRWRLRTFIGRYHGSG